MSSPAARSAGGPTGTAAPGGRRKAVRWAPSHNGQSGALLEVVFRMTPHAPIRPLQFVLLLALLAVTPASRVGAQIPEDTVKSVVDAIQRGSVRGLTEHAAERLEIGLFGAAQLFSRGQARYVLASFFRDHPAASVAVREAVSNEEAWYAALDYYRSGGLVPFTVYVRMRPSKGAWELREFVVLEARGS